MNKIENLKIGQQIKFDSDNGILEGSIIELYRDPQKIEDYTYEIVAEVVGQDVNYNLSIEHII